MEASKGDMPEEPAPESLPTEAAEAKPKRTMMLAVIIVVIIVIAAIGAAFGLGLLGKKKEKNQAPTVGVVATTASTVDIGGSVSFMATATDTDGTIANYSWYFGDGQTDSGAAKSNVTHTYTYGGAYWVYVVVTDDKGATGDNEAAMVRVFVTLYDPIAEGLALTNLTAPYATLIADSDIVTKGTVVNYDATGSYAFGNWHLSNASDPNSTQIVEPSYLYLGNVTLDYGDGSAAASITPSASMKSPHTLAESGHYGALLTVSSNYSVTTKVMLTVHVLKAAITGGIKNPTALIEVTIGEPDYLDPAVDYETAGGEVLQNTYETLVFYDGASAVNLVPMLANETPSLTNGGITADGLNYTFHLKTGVLFHNGETMKASDVIYSAQRLVRIHDPDGPAWMVEAITTLYLSSYIGDELQNYTADMSPPQWILDAIGGNTTTYKITELDNQNVSEAAFTAIGDYTVNFRLAMPYPGFLQICAYTAMDIVSKKYINDNQPDVNGEQNTFMNSHECGTGPYKLVTWDVGSKIYLTRFDQYHGTAPALKDVYVIKANDVNTRILMIQGGDADIAIMPIEYENLFAGKSAYYISKGNQTLSIDFIGFNLLINTTAASQFGSTVPANFFADKNVRLAFAHLFNYASYITNVRKNNAILPNGPIPKGMFGYNASQPTYTYDLAMARSYLENATNPSTTHSWWDDGFSIAFMFNAGNTYREAACQYMKDGLESLGSQFSATVNALDWPTYLANLRKSPSPFPMFWLGWAPDYNDPDDYVVPMLQTGGTFPNRMHYSNATIDALIPQAATETNATQRQALYDQITNLTYNDVPYIWLAQPNNFHVERSWMHGFVFNPMYAGFIWSAFTKS